MIHVVIGVLLALSPINAAFLGTTHALDPSTYRVNSFQLIATGKMYCGMLRQPVAPTVDDLQWVYKANFITAAQGAAVQEAAIRFYCPEVRK